MPISFVTEIEKPKPVQKQTTNPVTPVTTEKSSDDVMNISSDKENQPPTTTASQPLANLKITDAKKPDPVEPPSKITHKEKEPDSSVSISVNSCTSHQFF